MRSKGTSLAWAAVVGGGCLVPQGGVPPVVDPWSLPAPTIEDVQVRCDRQSGRWTVEVRASAWAGGGGLWWTADGERGERHTGLRSVSAAPDGLGDRLVLDVSVVDAVRGAGNGRTLYRCDAELSGALELRDLAGDRVDCVRWGPDPDQLDGLDGDLAIPEDCARALPWEDEDGDEDA